MLVPKSRTYLVSDDQLIERWISDLPSSSVSLGYLSSPESRIAVRIEGSHARLVFQEKGRDALYPIALEDAYRMLEGNLVGSQLHWDEYWVDVDSLYWRVMVKVYRAPLQGLCTATVLPAEHGESQAIPTWMATEVTDLPAYQGWHLAVASAAK